MTPTHFYPTPNNVASATTGYAAGSGSMSLAPGSGAAFGASFPLAFSTFSLAGVHQGVYSCSGRSGDTLTGLTLLSGTDASIPAGSPVEVRWADEHVRQITAAINALESTVGGYGDVVTHAAADFEPAGTAAAAVAPRGGTTTFNADGSITATDDTGQTVTTTFNADGSITATYGPPLSTTITTTFNADGSITRTKS